MDGAPHSAQNAPSESQKSGENVDKMKHKHPGDSQSTCYWYV